MRASGIEVAAEALDVELCIEQGEEPVLVEAFIAEPPVEALDVRVLHRLAWLDELQRDAAIRGPRVERATAKLTAIVEREPRRSPAHGDDRLVSIDSETRELVELTRAEGRIEVVTAYDGLELDV